MSILFALTLLVSSALLFLVQPMAAKMVLPILGGSPAVWNTCMVFFQAGLLAGYASAHFLPRWLGTRRHALVQVLALIAAFWFLPVYIERDVTPPEAPVLWLLGTLLVTMGWPFVIVAVSGPLLQKWFAETTRRDPYYLYAASNLGSFAALIAYPFLLEPWLALHEQAQVWTWGFGLLLALTGVCALVLWREGSKAQPVPDGRGSEPVFPSESVSAWQRTRWVLLALVPSSLMLSVTNYLTADIAPIPFLWVIPIGVYLLTFSLVFAKKPLLPHWLLVRWQPAVMLMLLIVLLSEATEPLGLILGLHLIGFFWFAMVCHGELARTRPGAAHLTEFYLWLAVGGVLGGILNGLAAPLIFSSYLEYPLILVAACLLRPTEKDLETTDVLPPWRVWNRADLVMPLALGLITTAMVLGLQSQNLEAGPVSVAAMFAVPALICFTFVERPGRFGLGVAAILLASAFYHGVLGVASFQDRSFFGVHRVTEKDGLRRFVHGSTVHGLQRVNDIVPEPLGYYTIEAPISQIFKNLKDDPRMKRVGIIGLGTGAMASFAAPGEHWTFFEIDPIVIKVARDPALFSFLRHSRGRIDIELGDARLRLQKYEGKFGVLVVDAFGGDAIPAHLVTREALALYLAHLEDNGLLVFHISNRYLDLEPVVANLAAASDPPLAARIAKDLVKKENDEQNGRFPSIWMVLARRPEDLARLKPGQSWAWRPARPRPDWRPWTDDYSNLLQAVRWGGSQE